MSPSLFTLFADLLSRILSRAEGAGRLQGIKITRSNHRITHLMYVDDLVIYCKATVEDAKKIKDYLNLYCQWSRQHINWEKSDIHFRPDVTCNTRNSLCRVLSMRECTHVSKYLGNPFYKFTTKSSEFNYIAKRMAAKLTGLEIQELINGEQIDVDQSSFNDYSIVHYTCISSSQLSL